MSLESYLEILKDDDFNAPKEVVYVRDGKTHRWMDEFSGSSRRIRTQVCKKK
jgi:hypothetical protein